MRPITAARAMAGALFISLIAGCSGGGGDAPASAPPPAPPPGGTTGPQIATAAGVIEGVETEGADAFLGVPYAAPPVGALRFRPPEPAPAHSGVLETTAFSEVCLQPAETTDNSDPPLGAEDCLYLNLWTPSDRAPGAALPVMVFLHGGANLVSSASETLDALLDLPDPAPLYDGARLSALGDVIVVTLNYRLGTLGFLAHQSLIADGATGSAGNYGALDQIAALQWVQDNIAAFGGDPTRVLLFGQSAGAYDVCTLMASPLAAGLFSRAAMHSGSCAIHSTATARANAEALVEEVGCAGAADIPACLRALPAETLANADAALPLGLGSFRMYPAVDGHVVDDRPIEIIRAGAHNAMPYMVGSTSEEYLTRFQGVPDALYEDVLAALVGQANVDEVVALYPLAEFPSADAAVSAAISDRNITCPARYFAASVATAQSEPVFRYFFSRTASTAARQADGAYHASELLFLFQNMDGAEFSATEDDRTVEATMRRYWTQFAASGDPNTALEAPWAPYVPSTDPYQTIDVVTAGGLDLFKERCDYWLSGAPGAEEPPGATVRIGAGAGSFGDPELLSSENLIAYQSANGGIHMAALDPASGLFAPEDGVLLDTGAAALLTSFNGPEFGQDQDGWSIFYTKEEAGALQIWRAEPDGAGGATAAPLTSGDPHTTAIVSRNAARDDVLVAAVNGEFASGLGDVVYFADSDPAAEIVVDPVDTRETTHPTWTEGEARLVLREAEGAAAGQLFLLDPETGTRTQITDDDGDKTFPLGWIAPDFNGDLMVLALVDKAAVGVYRDLGGAFWTRITTLAVPEGSAGVTLGSPEPFVAAGKSYMTLSIQNNFSSAPGEADSEIWVFDMEDDPATRFAERCDDGAEGPQFRLDPESYLGEDQVFVYYNIARGTGTLELYRCASGVSTR